MYATQQLSLPSERQAHRVEKKPQPISVLELGRDDYSYVTRLETLYGLESRSYDEWIHLWDSNPAYRGMSSEWPRGWVLATHDHQIVGHLGNIPLWYEIEGRKLLAAASHAWVVDAKFRNYSILLLDRCFKQRNVDLYLCTSANHQSSGILSMFNSARVPAGSWDESIFWITNYVGFLRSWAAMKSQRFSRRPSKDLPNASGDLQPGTRNHGGVEYQKSFDQRFELFWQELRREQPGTLLAVRSQEVLQWHFKYALAKNRIWILTIAEGSRLLAYSIFSRQDNREYGLERMRLIDFQSLQGSSSLLLPMIESALGRCREARIHMLECIGLRPELHKLLTPLRPRRRHLPSWLYYYTAHDPELAARLRSPDIWNPSCFDGDSSL